MAKPQHAHPQGSQGPQTLSSHHVRNWWQLRSTPIAPHADDPHAHETMYMAGRGS